MAAMIWPTEGKMMKKTTAITCMFLDIGGVLLTDGWSHGSSTLAAKEFGLNLAADTQALLCSAAGGSTGKEVDKIGLLTELSAEFYTAKKINAPMLKGAAMNAECKLIKSETFGDHFAFIGEVLEISAEPTLSALLYHEGKYFKLGEQLPRPPQEVYEKTKALAEKYQKKQ